MLRNRGRRGGGMANAYGVSAGMDFNDYYGGFGGYDAYGYSTGGAGGMGANAMSMYGMAAAGGMVGSNTNSKDKASMKARVFVGNLNPKVVSREQLESIYCRFGMPTDISIHKGYAFVQYTSEAEARSAVSFTDGMSIGGQTIDVNIACEPKNKDGSNSSNGEPAAKKTKSILDDDSDDTNGVNVDINQLNDDSEFEKYPGVKDTIICGTTKKTFHDLESFGKHRIAQSKLAAAKKPFKKPEGEPDVLKCFICQQEFKTSWPLLGHLKAKHNMNCYVD